MRYVHLTIDSGHLLMSTCYGLGSSRKCHNDGGRLASPPRVSKLELMPVNYGVQRKHPHVPAPQTGVSCGPEIVLVCEVRLPLAS